MGTPFRAGVPVGGIEPRRWVWAVAAAFALLASMGFSWRMLPARVLPEIGGVGRGGPGLLGILSRHPPFDFGFRNFLADVVWLEAVQVAGNPMMAPADYDRLYALLDVVSNYDPKFEIPYLLGGLVLGESPNHAQEALDVLERGKRVYPADWRFPFYIGYTRYFSLGEPGAAGEAIGEASRQPGSPSYLPGLASRMLSEANDPDAALSLLDTILRGESDPTRRSVLERRIREVTVERDIQSLERAVARYREETGMLPGGLSDLVRGGILPSIPPEPNGGTYRLEEGGTVRSDRVAQRLRVFQRE